MRDECGQEFMSVILVPNSVVMEYKFHSESKNHIVQGDF